MLEQYLARQKSPPLFAFWLDDRKVIKLELKNPQIEQYLQTIFNLCDICYRVQAYACPYAIVMLKLVLLLIGSEAE